MSNSRLRPLDIVLIFAVLIVFVWSGIGPFDRLTWVLETFPVMIGAVVLAFTWKRFRLTDLALVLIALHMIILCVGGKYTYARVPLGDWVKDALHLARNHYDRLGHFVQGFVPAIITRELLIRLRVVTHRGWLSFLVVCVCMAISAAYELIEWITALISHEAAESFLGTQGDVWDTQEDMATCFVGAIVAIFILSRWHSRQIHELEKPAESA